MRASGFILVCSLLFSSTVFAQNKNGKNGHNGYTMYNGHNGNNGHKNSNGFRIWKLTSLSGEVKAGGFYREQELSRDGFSDEQKSSFLSGGAYLKTKSYFLHPTFLICDINAGYFPETSRNTYIVVPEQAEVRTLNKLDIRGTFFNQKKISLVLFANFDNSYQNREFITDIKSNSRQLGGALYYRNKFLPLSFNFHERQWTQLETNTNRHVSMDERVLQGKASRSFIKRDKNELNYTHTESANQNIFTDQNINPFLVKSIIDNVQFTSNIPVDAKRKYLLNSMISDFNQRETRDFNRLQVLEGITAKLPQDLTFSGNYNLNIIRQDMIKMNSQKVQSSLGYKPFQTIDSRLFYENTWVDHTAYKENVSKTGVDIRYNNKIPTQGRLSLSYTYFRGYQNMNTTPSDVIFSNEEYKLTDGQMVLLKKPYVKQNSVMVRDATGSVMYQLNADYLLIDRYPYMEIVRVPGGLIANNATVYVDYTATQPGSYNYNTDNHAFTASVFLFKRKLEIYYRISSQDYKNETNTEFQILNYYTHQTAGGRLDFGFINGGAEYSGYKSNIIPYRMVRYFINAQKNYREKIFINLNGNIQDYYLVNENINQKYSDISGKISYRFLKQTYLNFNLMYRHQEGRGIDLDLLTAKSEITSVIRQFSITAGAEAYRRTYVGEKINFNGVYVQCSRKF